MTHNERRLRELEVLHEAQIAVDRGYGTMDLAEAIHKLNQLPADMPSKALVSRHHPVTSQQAAVWMQDRVTDLCGRVFRALVHRYDTVMGLDPELAEPWETNRKAQAGMTADEVQVVLGLTHQTASARVTQLRDSGWLIDGGYRRNTRSGRKAIVWIPSEPALRAVAESNHPAGGGYDDAFDSMEEDRREFESRMP